MPDARSLAWLTGGFASGLGLAGLLHWHHKRPPLGRIYRVGDRFYADTPVVEELLRRVPGSERRDLTEARVYLYRRGKLGFTLIQRRTLPGQAGHLYAMDNFDASVEDLAIELVRFGLARSGGAFATWPTRGPGDTWTPAAIPLHPSAFDPGHQARNSVAPIPNPAPLAVGHYFKVGDNFYADDNFLLTLERFQGADFNKRTIVPLWLRGQLEIFEQTRAKMLPEQVGGLHRIEPHLRGVSLADLLIELEGLGLVSWGGTWQRFPTRLAGTRSTGPLTARTPGRAYEDAGLHLIDETARTNLLSRFPVEDGKVIWRNRAMTFTRDNIVAKDSPGPLYVVTPVNGAPEDEAARAFVEELILHRIARRATFKPTGPTSTAAQAIPPAVIERLVATLPRPDLAPLRELTRRHQVLPGSLVILPLDSAEAEVFDPDHRHALALRLPDGSGFMFTFGELADPGADDLRDPGRLWSWGAEDDPDTEAVLLARDLDWSDVATILGLDPATTGP